MTQRSKDTPQLIPFSQRLGRLPWWLIVLALLGVLFAWHVGTDKTYGQIFRALSEGLGITIEVTVIAYSLSVILGLLLAFARMSKNPVIYQVSTFFVEIVRGLPILALLLYIAYVVTPMLIDLINTIGRSMVGGTLNDWGTALAQIRLRDVSPMARAIAALVLAYGSFISEIFRAGISSIDRGQLEAARALGMSYWQAMRHIILPQAFRNVLPPLGNDLIAMLKDSSLVSVIGVRDMAGAAYIDMASSYALFETYNVMVFLYLSMTLVLSVLVQWVERRVNRDRR